MNNLTLISYFYLFFGVLNTTIDINKKTRIILYSLLYISTSLALLFQLDPLQIELAPMLIVAPLLCFSEFFIRKITNSYLLMGSSLLWFYFVQNLGSPYQYFILLLLESIMLISILDVEANKIKTKLVVHRFLSRLVTITALFVVSLVSETEYIIFQVPLIILLLIQYLYNARENGNYLISKKQEFNSFYFKCFKTVLIPVAMLYELKSLIHDVNFTYIDRIHNVFFILSIVFVIISIWRKLTVEQISKNNENDKLLIMLPFILFYLLSDNIGVNILVVFSFIVFLLYELLLVSKNSSYAKIINNILYLSPVNPLVYWFMNQLDNSTIDIHEKILIIILIILSWTNLFFKKYEKMKITKVKLFEGYIIILLITSVVYIYEKI